MKMIKYFSFFFLSKLKIESKKKLFIFFFDNNQFPKQKKVNQIEIEKK